MQRDFDLIRAILIDAESHPPGEYTLKIPGHDSKTVAAHVEILLEAGLLKGKVVAPGKAYIFRLTWDGHEFLDSIKESATWETIKATVKDKTGGLTYDLLKELLKALGRDALGLP